MENLTPEEMKTLKRIAYLNRPRQRRRLVIALIFGVAVGAAIFIPFIIMAYCGPLSIHCR